jgi:hypothetical protein
MSLLSSSFNTGTYIVTRYTPGALVDGIPLADATSTFNIDASVQPLSGRALQDLPEGMRADDNRWVFTESEIRTVQTTNHPDTIEINGESYRAIKSEYFNVLSDHYRVTVEKVNVP